MIGVEKSCRMVDDCVTDHLSSAREVDVVVDVKMEGVVDELEECQKISCDVLGYILSSSQELKLSRNERSDPRLLAWRIGPENEG